MKILYLNITVGCKEADRFKRLVSFVAKQKPDVLGLSELNGWDKNNFAKLNKFKSQTGLKFSLFCKSPHGYHIGLFSKAQLKKKDISNRGFQHGVIVATFKSDGKTYVLALTHLSPLSEALRLGEIRRILAMLKTRQHTILCGDLNSLSPQDTINDAALLHKAKRLNIKKFGTDRIEKEVISKILGQGLVDTTYINKPRPPIYSVPTGFTHDPKHFARLRLDYIFVTKDLQAKVRKAGILRDKETNILSDHYPVFVQLKP